jgi:eukaryotic-like serine/threonine-protein kinase
MHSEPVPTSPPTVLPLGTVIGSWRVVGWAGRGVHGTVYRAVPVDSERAPPVALKVALLPRDPRFAREAELLSRTRHPSIPRLVGSGDWRLPDGTVHPFIAMEWVDGVPLYEWARQGPPSSRQVLGVLAQLASALAALHAHGGVHRDVKGGNVLVRRSDGRAVLTDLGTGRYPDAVTLTPPGVHLGTPAYCSPEAGLFELQSLRDRSARYAAGPADDVYALGVTACRLVTGEYPQFADPWMDEHGTWRLDEILPPASMSQVEPRLRELIQRMLSVRPEQRGTAAQLARALEQATDAMPLPKPRARIRTWSSVTAGGLALGAWVGWLATCEPWDEPIPARIQASVRGPRDAGTTELGEAAAAASKEESSGSPIPPVMAEDPLPEPQEGQSEPDAKGRCPHKRQVSLNGGCWLLQPQEPEACEALNGQMIKGTCYIPIYPRGKHPRPPTSGPTKKSAPQ